MRGGIREALVDFGRALEVVEQRGAVDWSSAGMNVLGNPESHGSVGGLGESQARGAVLSSRRGVERKKRSPTSENN